jgi:hypothetical protein
MYMFTSFLDYISSNHLANHIFKSIVRQQCLEGGPSDIKRIAIAMYLGGTIGDFSGDQDFSLRQIISQVHQCHLHSIEDDGCGGKILSHLLNNAVAAGNRVRSETVTFKGSVSVSSAAMELSEMK